MVYRVAIAGASGYAGGELIRLICAHPELELATLAASTRVGVPVSQVHPGLTGVCERVFEPTAYIADSDCDVLILALPHGESAALVAQLPADLPIVDLGADFRLREEADWRGYYGGSHAGTWPYGLPELPEQRRELSQAVRIANPGCYATAVALALTPLLAADLIGAEDIVVVAASGTSGAGRKLTESLLASQVMGAMSSYKAGGDHQHIPEMEQTLSWAAGRRVTMSFTPLLAPMPRGILAICTARMGQGVNQVLLRDAMHGSYDHEPFIQVLPDGQLPTTSATLGANSVHIQVLLDSHSGRVVVLSALDNLVKGAAGQALQNANILLDLPETMGLSAVGVTP